MSFLPRGHTTYGWHKRPIGVRMDFPGWAQISGNEANRAYQSARNWCWKYAPELRVRQHYNRERGVTTLWLEERAA